MCFKRVHKFTTEEHEGCAAYSVTRVGDFLHFGQL